MKKLFYLFLLAATLAGTQSFAGPLHEAARAGQLGQVRQLISKGANVNELDYYGFSPLLLAKLNDHDQTAALLTSKGASEQLDTLVRRLQFYLTELGYASGGIDGQLGPDTRDAIRAFQRDNNFKVSGRVEEPWVHKLHNIMLARVQTDLKKLGFYGGDVDGLVGPATRDSIRSFQQQAGLKINFTPEPDWIRAIQTALRRTSTAANTSTLKTLQEKLLVLGYNPGLPDGLMGNATAQAIREFQSRHKLSVTGQPEGEWLSTLDREVLRTIQQQLTSQGFDAGPADGAFGSRTEQAIRKFQQQTGLPVDGRPSAQLISALQKASSRKTASVPETSVQQSPPKRELIERVQRRLHALNYKIGNIDGQLGPATESAVKEFQQQQKLAVDGQISEQLLVALDQALQAQQQKTAQHKVEVSPDATTLPASSQQLASLSETGTEPAPTPSAVLSDKALITELQSRLNSLGYNVGSADGEAGPRTRRAIQAFQRQVGITVDGKPSLALLNTIKTTPLAKARAPANSKKTSAASGGRNTEVRGRLVLQKSSNGTLVGCSIGGVQLDPSWCQPFTARNNTKDCKAIIRPNSKVLLVKCG